VNVGESRIKKFAFGISIFLMSALLVSGQSLVEAAKKERARRAALRAKGIKSILVTNADLKKGYTPPIVSTKPDSKPPQRKTSRSTPTPRPRPSRERSTRQQEQNLDQSSDIYQNRSYATRVLLTSELVRNPDFALKKPDGQYAELSLQGVLDLEVDIQNGPGDDMAVYSRISGSQETMAGSEEEGGVPETLGLDLHEGLWYGVMALNKRGEWEELGRGRGRNGSEKFDLGSVSSTKKIRIIFRPLIIPDVPVRYVRSHSRELTCGIDAIEALH
jgi:hypothetical protein